jgi:transposase InsO family protein
VKTVQTDRGREFFAYCFQEKLMEYGIKFRPIEPALPHLNGKAERSQRTDLDLPHSGQKVTMGRLVPPHSRSGTESALELHLRSALSSAQV